MLKKVEIKKIMLIYIITMITFVLTLSGCHAEPRERGQVQHYGFSENEQVPERVSIENEYLLLEYLTETAEIIVTEKATGHVWRSTPEDAINDSDATHITKMRMMSLFILEFENEAGVGEPYDAWRFSISEGNFEHELVDDALDVHFTVGSFSEIFVLPPAMSVERFENFADNLTGMSKITLLDAFGLTSLDSLRPSDDRGALTSQFPRLEDEDLFILRDTLPIHMLRSAEEALTEAGYTYEDWQYDMNLHGFETEEQCIFNLTLRFELDGNSMVVTVPFDSINHSNDFFPTQIALMPFFGAGNPQKHDGYAFVPDGSGALIHFDNARHNQLPYANNVFGWDTVVHRDLLIQDNRAAFPVFGVHKNDQTFVGIIEEGASYAQIRAEVSGMSGAYTAVFPSFRLIHGEQLVIPGRTDIRLMMHEEGLPIGEDVSVKYTFIDQSGYVGMAVAYREYLQSRYPWLLERNSHAMTAAIEILGAATTTQHFLGFPVDRPQALTTYGQAADMLHDMQAMGWQEIQVKMRGAHNESINHQVPNRLRLINELGGHREFDRLIDVAEETGVGFFLEGDFVHMRSDSTFDGFSQARDGATRVNRERMTFNGHSEIHFSEHGSTSMFADPHVIARPVYTVDLIHNFVEEASHLGVDGIAFRSLASALGGDFHERRHVSRESAMNMRVELLSDLSEQGIPIWLNYGFSYAAPFADLITGMPLSDQRFGVTDTRVPFYQIALHGLIHFTGEPINLVQDFSDHWLKSVESGAGLFFSFMDEPTSVLQDTGYRKYYANEFGLWAEVANELFHRHQQDFGHLYNQLIVDHQLLATDVTITIYEDGTSVYVNHSINDFKYDDLLIPARNYVVVR